MESAHPWLQELHGPPQQPNPRYIGQTRDRSSTPGTTSCLTDRAGIKLEVDPETGCYVNCPTSGV